MSAKQPDPAQSYRTWGRSRAVRFDQYDYTSDAVIHLVLCARSATALTAEAIARMVCEAIEFRCREHGYRLYGYCLMPEHVHILLSPAESGIAVATWLQRFKSFTAHEFVRLGGTPPLWQRSAYDHVCREGETAEAVLTYVINNPVRAGLVECWRDWRWTKAFIDL